MLFCFFHCTLFQHLSFSRFNSCCSVHYYILLRKSVMIKKEEEEELRCLNDELFQRDFRREKVLKIDKLISIQLNFNLIIIFFYERQI